MCMLHVVHCAWHSVHSIEICTIFRIDVNYCWHAHSHNPLHKFEITPKLSRYPKIYSHLNELRFRFQLIRWLNLHILHFKFQPTVCHKIFVLLIFHSHSPNMCASSLSFFFLFLHGILINNILTRYVTPVEHTSVLCISSSLLLNYDYYYLLFVFIKAILKF